MEIREHRRGEGCLYLPRGVDPGEMGEVGVHGNGDDLAVHVVKLVGFVAESDDLCGTHEGAGEKGQRLSSENLRGFKILT